MSISVPTAVEKPTDPSPPGGGPGRRWVGWLAIVVVALLAVVALEPESETSAEATDPVDAPSVTFPDDATVAAMPDLDREIVFPGEGRVVALAGSLSGQVLVGQRSEPAGAFVYTADPAGMEWSPAPLAVAERAWVGAVSPWIDGFVIGGAIVGPGMGSSVPTLWAGLAGGEFSTIEHPFPGPGRIDRIEVIGGDLYLVGQASAPFTDTGRDGVARFGRLLVGRPNEWTDITPPGASVLVADIAGFDDGLVAVGGDDGGAVLWWTTDPSSEWSTIRLGAGLATDVVAYPASVVVSARATRSDGVVVSRLLAGASPDALDPVGFPVEVPIDGLVPVDGGVLGGSPAEARGSGLWLHREATGWEPVPLGRSLPGARVAYAGASPGVLTVVGSSAGQPAIWTGSDLPSRVNLESGSRQWQFVSLLPTVPRTVSDASPTVVSTGTYLYAFTDSLDVRTLWVSSASGPWRAFETVDGFGFVGATEHPGGAVVFGDTGYQSVVYEFSGTSAPEVHVLPGLAVRHAARGDGGLTVLGVEEGTPVRLRLEDDGAAARQDLGSLPARITVADGVLIGASFGEPGIAVSHDDGVSWRTVPHVFLPEGMPGRPVLVISTTGEVLALDPHTMELTSTGHGLESNRVVNWGSGLVVERGLSPIVVADPEEGTSSLDLGVSEGMRGVFVRVVAGPGRYVLVTERGTPALYRWLGMGR
ncbi:MAG: hypothetical protein R3246_00570 [Acidimicrobiia bacterium]|nr:hypothetical protein [Acidimicrobiia bacterium]